MFQIFCYCSQQLLQFVFGYVYYISNIFMSLLFEGESGFDVGYCQKLDKAKSGK